MKNLLITGSAGFIGSNFVNYFFKKYPKYNLITIDLLTYAGKISNIEKTVYSNSRFKLLKEDIRDLDVIKSVFKEYKIDGVIHFAAESHVDNSITDPSVFLNTNILGTFNILESARDSWMNSDLEYKSEFIGSRFHHISTDEIYGSLELDSQDLFTENSMIKPSSPYSASKASSDMLVKSYFHTYGLDVVITNCSNNYGPNQHDEKLIPTIIRNVLSGNKIPIYGDGKNVRDWLYVLDHCKGIDRVYHSGISGETYNIGGNAEKNNIEIVLLICDVLNRELDKDFSYDELIKYVPDRPGHDKRYAIDASKIRNELNFSPETSFEDGLSETVKWYIQKYLKDTKK